MTSPHKDSKTTVRSALTSAGSPDSKNCARDLKVQTPPAVAKRGAGLADVTDPGAAPMVMKVFGSGSEPMQLVAIELLSQIQGPAASLWLASLALDDPSAVVRRQAADALTHRDPRDLIGHLISRVQKPYKYEVKPAVGPGSPADLIVDGQRFDIQRLYPMPDLSIPLMPMINPDIYATAANAGNNNAMQTNPAAIELSARIAAYQAQQRQISIANTAAQIRERDLAVQRTVENQVRLIEDLNARINESNELVLPLLGALTGQAFGANQEPWRNWWSEELDLLLVAGSSSTKPATAETVKVANTKPADPKTSAQRLPHRACFVAGTLVHASDGPRPVESINVGDLVLSQNVTSGELSLHPVLAVHRIKPTPTLRIVIDRDEETIVATAIHRFWTIGNGWTMAADLKAGDKLRMIGGVVAVKAIEPDKTQTVYNVDVDQNRDFFVGKAGLLVHDFSFVQAVLSPFDRLLEPKVRAAPAGNGADDSR